MKSQIGTSYNLNKQYNFYCTNLSVDKLKNFSYGLPNNAIIISSPTDSNSYDIGTPSILMTDYNSNIISLTYTLDKNQFTFDEKTNTTRFKEAIIDRKFKDYYDKLIKIENNINVKHEAVSYLYSNVYNYYNETSSYYDIVSEYYDDIEYYYDNISYYYEEIVKKYDNIKQSISDVKGELYEEIKSLKEATQEAVKAAINNLKTTYIMPIYNMTDDLDTRITNLEKLHENDITNNTNNEIINSFDGIRDGLGSNSDFQIIPLGTIPPTGGTIIGGGNNSDTTPPTETLPPNNNPITGGGGTIGTRPNKPGYKPIK